AGDVDRRHRQVRIAQPLEQHLHAAEVEVRWFVEARLALEIGERQELVNGVSVLQGAPSSIAAPPVCVAAGAGSLWEVCPAVRGVQRAAVNRPL
ncbi:MAG: hypothetical protein V3S18_06400, partial [Dehalococcoidia bacterium]